MQERIRKNAQSARNSADFYDKFWQYIPENFNDFDEMRAAFITSTIQDFTSGAKLDLLDIGCGTGWLSCFIHQYGSVIGVDYSSKAIDFANEHYMKYGQFFVADSDRDNLGLGEESKFDVVIASEVIEHVVDHEAFVAQVSSFLKPNGLWIITTPNKRVFSEVSSRYKSVFQPIENWLTPPELVHLLNTNQFEVLRHDGAVFKNIDYGFRGYFVSKRLANLSKKLGLLNLYNILLLHTSVYQLMVARKIN